MTNLQNVPAMKLVIHIIKGWLKHWGLISTSTAEVKLSDLRLAQCRDCEFSKKSKVLEILNGNADYVDTIYCTRCTCPASQKSLVVDEYCPVGKW